MLRRWSYFIEHAFSICAVSQRTWPVHCNWLDNWLSSWRSKCKQGYASVWGWAWNVKPFSWAMKKNMAIILICHSSLINLHPSNFWPLAGVWVLSVFKLMFHANLRPPGSWLWGPQGLRSSAFSKLVFSYVIVINRNKFNFVGFWIIQKFEGL